MGTLDAADEPAVEVPLELVADGVLDELDEGVTLEVAVGSDVLLDVEPPLGDGDTGPITGPPVRVGEPVDVGEPLGVGDPDPVGVPDDLVGLGDVDVAVGVEVLDEEVAGLTRGLRAITGAPGKWARVVDGTKEGTRVA